MKPIIYFITGLLTGLILASIAVDAEQTIQLPSQTEMQCQANLQMTNKILQELMQATDCKIEGSEIKCPDKPKVEEKKVEKK